jgi:hypothetical protein
MGLDMYLEARKYINRIDWKTVPQGKLADGATLDDYVSQEFKEVQEMFPTKLTKHAEGGSTVSVNIGYWRKANQIHNWFVTNVQDGKDNCEPHQVSVTELSQLVSSIDTVLAGDIETAKRELPVLAGSFFGNYDEEEGYNLYYYEELTTTKEMLEDIIAARVEGDGYDMYYQSSW